MILVSNKTAVLLLITEINLKQVNYTSYCIFSTSYTNWNKNRPISLMPMIRDILKMILFLKVPFSICLVSRYYFSQGVKSVWFYLLKLSPLKQRAPLEEQVCRPAPARTSPGGNIEYIQCIMRRSLQVDSTLERLLYGALIYFAMTNVF